MSSVLLSNNCIFQSLAIFIATPIKVFSFTILFVHLHTIPTAFSDFGSKLGKMIEIVKLYFVKVPFGLATNFNGSSWSCPLLRMQSKTNLDA